MKVMKFSKALAVILCLAVSFVCLAPHGVARGQASATKTESSSEETRSLPAIHSRAEFDRLSRVYTDQPYALPHVLFVIERKDGYKIYYVNSQRYRFDKDFVNGTYLSLESGEEFWKNNYINPNRRFILGTLAWQSPVRRYTFEFWEGDQISADQIKLTADVLKKSFFAPVAFKPNSTKQEEDSAAVQGLERVLQSDIAREQEYQAL